MLKEKSAFWASETYKYLMKSKKDSTMKLNRLFGALLIIVVAVAIVVFIVFQQQNSFCPSRAVLEPAAPGYIGNSSIYLLSAKPYYGTYHGTPVFMVDVTVRNDYTAEQPAPSPFPGWAPGEVNFLLRANLYSKTAQINSQIYVQNGAEPFYYDITMGSGETTSFSIYMVTSQRDVENYTLTFEFLSGYPVI